MRTGLIFALLLTSCGGAADSTPTDRDRYVDALCRLYVEAPCVASQDASCGLSVSFDSIGDCGLFFSLALSDCDGVTEAMEGNSDVAACISDLDALDCNTADVCDSDQELALGASCDAVDVLIAGRCPDQDSGI